MSGQIPAVFAAELERMRLRTREARETVARKLYERRAVAAAMSAASAEGQSRVTIEPELPTDLRKTKAAEELTEWLKASGFEVTWHKKSKPERDLEWWVVTIDWS